MGLSVVVFARRKVSMRIAVRIVCVYCSCSIIWAAIGLAEPRIIHREKDISFDMNATYDFYERYISINQVKKDYINLDVLFNKPKKLHSYFIADFALNEGYPLSNAHLLTEYTDQENTSDVPMNFQKDVEILINTLSKPACLSANENEFLAHYNKYKEFFINNQAMFTQLANTLKKKRGENFIELSYDAKKEIRMSYEKNTEGYLDIGDVFHTVEERRLLPYPDRMSIRYECAKSIADKPGGYYMAIRFIDGYTRGAYFQVGIEYATNDFSPQPPGEHIKRKELSPNWYYFERSGVLD